MIDKRKELERLVVDSLEEIRDKGYTEERGIEYQRRQTEWWKECDKWQKWVMIYEYSGSEKPKAVIGVTPPRQKSPLLPLFFG